MSEAAQPEEQSHRHADFKCELVAKLRADLPDPDWTDGRGRVVVPRPDGVPDMRTEVHELIYTDGTVALTLYECCYAVFYVRTGELLSGSLWKRGEWHLDEPSRALAMLHASPEARERLREIDDSPPFTPAALEQLAARGYERQNRHKKG